MKRCSRLSFVLVSLLVSLCMSVSGCIGVAWVGDKKELVFTRDKDETLSIDRGMPPLGTLEREELDGEHGRWVRIYQRDGFLWTGPIVFLIVPVPLLIPMGHSHAIAIVDREGRTTVAEHGPTEKWGAVCGLFFHPHSPKDSGFHCGARSQ